MHTEEGEPIEVSIIEVSIKLSRGPFNKDTIEGHKRSKRAHKALDYQSMYNHGLLLKDNL